MQDPTAADLRFAEAFLKAAFAETTRGKYVLPSLAWWLFDSMSTWGSHFALDAVDRFPAVAAVVNAGQEKAWAHPGSVRSAWSILKGSAQDSGRPGGLWLVEHLPDLVPDAPFERAARALLAYDEGGTPFTAGHGAVDAFLEDARKARKRTRSPRKRALLVSVETRVMLTLLNL